MQELDKAIGDKATSPLAGILRIIPIERMNALLVITPQPAYLDEAKKWIARLDQAGTGDGPRFFVYNLQNQRAEKLGPLLTQAFTGRARRGRGTVRADARTRHAGGHDRQSADVPAAAGGHPADDHRQHAAGAGDANQARGPARRRRGGPARASASSATSRSSPTRTTTRC